jgi:nitrogen regulatory protein PII
VLLKGVRNRHRAKGGLDEFSRSRALDVVLRLGLEQFRVGQNDAQLIIQSVKQRAKIGRCGHGHLMIVHVQHVATASGLERGGVALGAKWPGAGVWDRSRLGR